MPRIEQDIVQKRCYSGLMRSESHALQCENCPVRDRAACASLDDEQRAQLRTIGRDVQYATGETIFHADDAAARCATLLEGLLKLVDRDSEGVERIVALIHPAGFVGELFAPFERFEVVALTPARLCMFDRPRYEDMASRYSELASGLARRAMVHLEEARALIGMIGRRGAKEKLAALLVELARAAGPSPCKPIDRLDLPLSREEIAALLGVNIETISRQFGVLEREGLIERQGLRTIIIHDMQRLSALAD